MPFVELRAQKHSSHDFKLELWMSVGENIYIMPQIIKIIPNTATKFVQLLKVELVERISELLKNI